MFLPSILLRFVDGIYSDRLNSTIGVDFKAKIVSVEDSSGQMKKVKLTVWDTGTTLNIARCCYRSIVYYLFLAGQEKFRTLTSNYYRGAHAVILVYDVSSRISFENLSGWLEDVDQFIGSRPVVKVFVSNKIDQARVVTKKEANEWASEHQLQLYETSAKAQEGVSDLFEAIVKQVQCIGPFRV